MIVPGFSNMQFLFLAESSTTVTESQLPTPMRSTSAAAISSGGVAPIVDPKSDDEEDDKDAYDATTAAGDLSDDSDSADDLDFEDEDDGKTGSRSRSHTLSQGGEFVDQRRAALETALEDATSRLLAIPIAQSLKKAAVEQEISEIRVKLAHIGHAEAKTQLWSSQYGSWQAVIESAEINPDAPHSAETRISGNLPVFVLAVSSRSRPNTGWIVTRSESDFLRLHQQLREISSDSLPPKLPGKRWSTLMSSSFSWLGRRKNVVGFDQETIAALNEYLRSVLNDDALCQSEPLFHFLCDAAPLVTGYRPQ
jgi:hypothetical protein